MPDFVLLAPAFLALIVLGAIVALLHQSHQRRAVAVSSLILWRRLQSLRQQAMPGARWPRPNLAMLLQIAALVLVALALARPLIGTDAGAPIHKIYVLDASGSMGAADQNGTRFDAAKARLAELLSQDIDPDGPRVSLIVAGPVPQLVLARQRDDHDLFADGAGRLQMSDGVADWSAVAALVENVRKRGDNEQVVVLSDGADADLGEIGGIPTTQIRFGSAVANAGLEARLVASADDADTVHLTGKVHFSGGSRQAQLSVWFQSANTTAPLQLAEQTIAAPTAPEVVGVDFDVDDLAIVGGGVLSARLSEDAQPSDNASNFVVDASPAPLQILLVGQRQPALLKALQSLEGAIVQPVDILPADVSGYGLVVVNDVAVDRQPETNTLWIGRGRIAGEAEPPALAPGEITAWRSDHALSRGIVWSSLALSRSVQITPWPGGDILLAAGGTPLIEARSGLHGREVRIAFDPTREWAQQTAFPQFLGNLVDWLGLSHEGRWRAPCVVGAPCPIDARWSGVISSMPDGAITQALPFAGGTFIPLQAGLYQHLEGQNAALLAVNPDWREDVSLTPMQAPETAAVPSPMRLWPWLLVVAAAVLGLEAWVSWREKSAPRWLWASRAVVLALMVAAFFNLPGPGLSGTGQTVIVAAAPLADTTGGVAAQLAGPGSVIVGDRTEVGGDLGEPILPPAKADEPWGSSSAALPVAAAMLPQGEANHVILAAGTPLRTQEIADLMPMFAGRHIAVDVGPVEGLPPNEVVLAAVEGPPSAFIGDSFRLTGRIRAGSDMEGHLQVSESGMRIAEQDIDLVQGDNQVDITIPKAREGDLFYQMAISATGDVLGQNNANGTWVKAVRAPRILVLSPDLAAGKDFGDGLAAQGLTVRVLVPTAAPWLIKDWLGYDGYVLNDVPAISLNPTQQELLAQAVSQHGRPLLILGGPHAFGPGGYLETPLDRLSPLSSRVPKPAPEAALVFVLDRSGSMSQMVGDTDRLEVAKQATLSAIALLNPQSLVSIIAFDTEPHIIVPLQPASQIDTIRDALNRLGPGGGTDLRPALATAVAQLRGAQYPVKHIIALTDGLTPPDDYAPLLDAIKADDVSVSTIAIGSGANLSILRDIAAAGGGVFHASNDFRALPSILSQEAMLMSDAAVEERETTPQWVGPRPDFMGGLPQALPAIGGYVLTTEKSDAAVAVTVETADGGTSPLLASWQYGSGTVIALTTQAYGPWTREWLAMPGYGGLWPEVLRHFLSGADAPGLALHLTQSGNGMDIVATALDAERLPRAGLDLSATVALQGKAPVAVRLHEAHAGLYEGTVELDASGDYRVAVSDGVEAADAMFHLAFPVRLAFEAGPDNARLAALTGGRVVPAGGELPPPGPVQLTLQPNWIFWALCAVAAFMIELLARYGGALLPWSRQRSKPGIATHYRRDRPKAAVRRPEYATGGN